jgi:hypothetical protein
MGLFCLAFLASLVFVRKLFWDGCAGKGRGEGLIKIKSAIAHALPTIDS